MQRLQRKNELVQDVFKWDCGSIDKPDMLFFLVSRSVWGSFAKQRGVHGAESGMTLNLGLSSYRTWHVVSRKAL